MDVCPVCGSRNLTKIDRMNGYLSYSRVHGDTRLNEAKMAEIAPNVNLCNIRVVLTDCAIKFRPQKRSM